MILRRTAFSLCLTVFLVINQGCAKGVNAKSGMVQIASTKSDLLGLPAEYRALQPALEDTLGKAVRFNSQPNGRSIGIQLDQGNVPYAVVTAAEYAAIPDPSKVTLVATAVNEIGKTTRRAHIIVRAKDDRLKTIADIQGKRFAFGKYGDILTDLAARSALENGGTPVKKLFLEVLTPPPFAMEGRLYVQNDAPTKIALDVTVNAGVVDEVAFSKLPDTGGNPITGPSKDQFRILGETDPIPEMCVIAGPSADPQTTAKLKDYLINRAKDNKTLCSQLGVTGFADADHAAYDSVRKLVPTKS